MRLIDADALRYRLSVTDDDEQIFYIRDEDIASAPTIDALPVVRSKWEVVERGLRYEIWKCKRCGDLLKVRKDTFNCGRGNCFFCPRCGADMREENHETIDR